MARLEYTGYDDFIRANDERSRRLAERIDKALRLAAQAVVEALQHEESTTFKAPTGEMGRILAASPRYSHAPGSSSAEVYPDGDYVGQFKPRRAATIAFVLEHGKGDAPANPWNKRASAKSRPRVSSIIEEQLRIGD